MGDPTKNNHFSPEFTNLPWANSHGNITRIRRGRDGRIVRDSRPTGPVQWGQEECLYPQPIENALSRFENQVAPVYRKLLVGEKLDSVERLIWSRWILCQCTRTPTYALEVARVGEKIATAFPEFSEDFSSIDMGESIDLALSDDLTIEKGNRLIPFIILRDWLLLRPAAEEFFIKGDVPVIIRGALVNDESIILYPLSPECCFRATVLGGFPPRQLQAEARLESGGTTSYLRLIAASAEREVICHPDHFSPELERIVAETLGASPFFINTSALPSHNG
jgi:hypothetical protein